MIPHPECKGRSRTNGGRTIMPRGKQSTMGAIGIDPREGKTPILTQGREGHKPKLVCQT